MVDCPSCLGLGTDAHGSCCPECGGMGMVAVTADEAGRIEARINAAVRWNG